jgi:exopolysaccharide biosynthesis protein
LVALVVATGAAGVSVAAKCGWLGRAPVRIARVKRAPVGGALEIVEAELERSGESGGKLIAVYFDPHVVTPSISLNTGLAPLATLESDAVAVVNAGFFTPERRPTGLLVSAGRTLSPFVPRAGGAGSGVFLLENGTASLIARDQVGKRSFQDVTLAIQAGPRIIEPGGKNGIVSDDGARANRTVIGTDGRGRVVLAVVLGPAGWASGPTLYELQHLLGDHGLGRTSTELAFRFALNLDGGPSTGMHVRSHERALDAPESAPVHSVLALRARP